MRAFSHIACAVALVFAFLVCPALAWADLSAITARLTGNAADVVSSATQIQAAPDGRFYVYINRELHTDEENLALWIDFFEGRDVPLIWEDISAVAVEGDAAGIELAESLQSRLPEHQMTLRLEDGALALSKAEAGRFDVLIVSEEAAEAYGAANLTESSDVVVVER